MKDLTLNIAISLLLAQNSVGAMDIGQRLRMQSQTSEKISQPQVFRFEESGRKVLVPEQSDSPPQLPKQLKTELRLIHKLLDREDTRN